jgi:hypothetical protein
MSTIRMEMWKKKKIEKNKEKCRKYYEKKKDEGRKAQMPKIGNVTVDTLLFSLSISYLPIK